MAQSRYKWWPSKCCSQDFVVGWALGVGVGRGWGASLASLTYVPRARTRKNTSGSCDTKRSGQIFLLIIGFSLSIAGDFIICGQHCHIGGQHCHIGGQHCHIGGQHCHIGGQHCHIGGQHCHIGGQHCHIGGQHCHIGGQHCHIGGQHCHIGGYAI